MRKLKDIICISMTTWEGDYMKTIVHMMGQLALNHRVLFVDYAFTWKDVLFTLLGKSNAPVARMIGWKPRLRTVSYKSASVFHLTLPPVLPINWISNPALFDFFLRIQAFFLGFAIRKASSSVGFQNPVVINAFHPALGYFLHGKLHESETIYYCYDEISGADWCGKHGGRLEQKFAKAVDRIVVSSQSLLQAKSQLNPNTALVPNGVDFALFHQQVKAAGNLQPVIGYLGSLDHRVDYDLLCDLIAAKPDWTFRFVGRVVGQKAVNMLRQFPNVELLGSKPVPDLPGYVAGFDVCMIPFLKNEFTRNIYPLKINEYLAAGKPVIATEFTDLSEFQELIYIADHQTFVHQIQLALLEQGELIDRRIAFAAGNDWTDRVKLLEQVINQNTYELA